MTTIKLTDTDRDVLARGAEGVSIRYVWHWTLNGVLVGRSVKKLEKAGLVHCMYFAGNKANACATEAGRVLVGKST
jgi:hypothetical protein